MMEVVVPLGRVRAGTAVRAAREMPRLVVPVLEHEVDLSAGNALLDRFGELSQEVRVGFVDDRVHGVETQAVESVLEQPDEGVLDEERADRAGSLVAIEIDRVSPRRLVTARE